MTLHPWVAQQFAAARRDDFRRDAERRKPLPPGRWRRACAALRARLGRGVIRVGQRIAGPVADPATPATPAVRGRLDCPGFPAR